MPLESQDLILSRVKPAFLDDKELCVRSPCFVTNITKAHQVQFYNHMCGIACLL